MSCGHAAEQARRIERERRARPDAALRQRPRGVQHRTSTHPSNPGAGPAACACPVEGGMLAKQAAEQSARQQTRAGAQHRAGWTRHSTVHSAELMSLTPETPPAEKSPAEKSPEEPRVGHEPSDEKPQGSWVGAARRGWCVLYTYICAHCAPRTHSTPLTHYTPRVHCSVPSRHRPARPPVTARQALRQLPPLTVYVDGCVRIRQRDARDFAAMVQTQQFSGGMVQQQQFSARRKQGSAWVLVGIAALAAVAGLMVAGTNAYLASDPWNLEPQRELFISPKGSLKHELDMGRAPVATVQLTPDLVRALLTLDEKAKKSQKSLVVTLYAKRTIYETY